MKPTRTAMTLAGLCLAMIAVAGCSRDKEGTATAEPTTAASTTQSTPKASTSVVPAPVDNPLAVTCAEFTKMDKAHQMTVILAIFGDDPAKNKDRVSIADLMCQSTYVHKPVKDALPHE